MYLSYYYNNETILSLLPPRRSKRGCYYIMDNNSIKKTPKRAPANIFDEDMTIFSGNLSTLPGMDKLLIRVATHCCSPKKEFKLTKESSALFTHYLNFLKKNNVSLDMTYLQDWVMHYLNKLKNNKNIKSIVEEDGDDFKMFHQSLWNFGNNPLATKQFPNI